MSITVVKLEEKLAVLEQQLKGLEADYFRVQGARDLLNTMIEEQDNNKEKKADAKTSKSNTKSTE